MNVFLPQICYTKTPLKYTHIKKGEISHIDTHLRLIDDSHNIQTSNDTSIFGGLSLSVIEVGRYCYNSVGDFVPKILFSNLFHLSKYHGTDLFRGKCLCASLDINLNVWFLVFLFHSERPIFDVFLNCWVVPCSANHAFSIENSVCGVGCQLVLSSISDQSFSVSSEGHVGGSDSVTLIIGNDVNTAILVNTNTVQERDR